MVRKNLSSWMKNKKIKKPLDKPGIKAIMSIDNVIIKDEMKKVIKFKLLDEKGEGI